MKKIIYILIILSVNKGYSQVYEFINDTLIFSQKDSIYLKNRFLDIDKKISIQLFNEINLRDLWYPLPQTQSPSINLFLENFNLNHIQSDLLKSKQDSIIDFKKLNDKFVSVSKVFQNKHPKHTYIQISKPFYNCSKSWAIIFIDIGNRFYNYGNGYFYIYRKIDNKWELYHKLELWMS